MAPDAVGELLTVVLDINLFVRPQPDAEGASTQALLNQVLTFLRAQLLLNEQNQLSVIAVTPWSSPVLFAASSSSDPEAMCASVCHRLQQLVQQQQLLPDGSGAAGEAALSGGLSRALCSINRLLPRYDTSRSRSRPRILVLSATPDSPVQYIPVMNAIFAAQNAKVVIDSLVLHSGNSSFLQQAAHLTGGQYFKPKQPEGLLQYLLSMYSADTHTRQALNLPAAAGVDYRASCFCHKQTIDQGYICSVCLSIFCKANMKLAACLTCGSEFNKASAVSKG